MAQSGLHERLGLLVQPSKHNRVWKVKERQGNSGKKLVLFFYSYFSTCSFAVKYDLAINTDNHLRIIIIIIHAEIPIELFMHTRKYFTSASYRHSFTLIIEVQDVKHLDVLLSETLKKTTTINTLISVDKFTHTSESSPLLSMSTVRVNGLRPCVLLHNYL